MKKLAALTMAALMAVSVAGCGSSKTEETTPAETKTESAAESKDAAETEAKADAEEAEADGEKKVYQIATDTTFAPFEFENEKGEMVGIDLDLLKAIAEDQGFEYELQVVGFNAAVTSLEAGESDAVIAGMSITPQRQEKYDFSEPYFESGVGCAVLADSDIDDYDDLKGQQVAAKTGTEGCKFAKSIADQYGFTVAEFDSSSNMYQDVLTGTSAACFEDYPVMGYEITRGVELKLLDKLESKNSYGLGVMKGENGELVEMFNAGLKNLQDSGKYDEIVNTYITK
ncbi:transporter substrate-binding domain-containing protein [Clostridium sp. AM58-1XD]|uniref:transporter substrate-binding domain-containing protein n=1 Tax=Clostridium sp. AM58-1XD TaxID=2292307 RepID=UPI000E50F98E|nr:transporter substrate-binding domain-containing protein [Clostridium sp. AM58-1XD]RGY97460.1 glutamine ABC transporter substrate-binding protein [Clostridium sp. AM58-1XD]